MPPRPGSPRFRAWCRRPRSSAADAPSPRVARSPASAAAWRALRSRTRPAATWSRASPWPRAGLPRRRPRRWRAEMVAPPLLEVTDLRKHYHAPRRWLGPQPPPVRAVDGVSFHVARGETLALVGESGCGKTTTAKSVMRLIEPTSGSVRLEGKELVGLPRQAMRQHRRDLQIIFQ